MRSTNKKFISALACASAMTALAIVDPMGVTKTHQVAQAATDTIPAKSTGVDVSSWQGTKLDQQAKSGAQFAVVKVSEGTNYQNPNAQGQIQSAEQNNMMTMGYHYTHFGSNSNQAVQEGNYAVNSAQQAGLPQGSYLATDWEQDVNNNTNGSVAANTNAITSFMDTVHDGGYNPMLYSSEWLLKNKVDTNKISEKYPNALWVAKYKTNGREDNPDYNYFPSMDNVAIWQYTQNWRGQNVDGNVNVVPLSNKTTADNNNTSTNAANTNNSNANNGQSSSQAPANPIINNSNATAKPNNNNSTQPAQPTETKPAEKPSTTTNVNSDWTKQNGVFVTGGAINLRTGASTDSKVITQLPANSEVKYDAYRTIGQYTWLRQPRANNEYGYLVGRDNGQAWGTFKEGSATTAKPNTNTTNNKPAENTNKPSQPSQNTQNEEKATWVKQEGTFITAGPINLRTAPSTKSAIIAQLPAGSEVNYDAYYQTGNYVWLRQPRANNQYGYLVGRNNGQAWGTFGKYRVLKDRADSTQYYTSQYNPVFAPWGCASAALSMLMKYDGTFKNVPGSTEYAKLKYMQDNLPRNKNLGGQDGNPYTGAGFTRVILSKALTNYAHQLGDKNVRDISGASLDTIANLVLDGHPVLYYGWSSYNGGGNMARNHCKVIMGYNGANNTFLVHDPLYMNKHFYKGGGGMREGIYNGYDLGPISWVSANSIAKEYAYKGGYNALTI